ncbi:hypothetical protein SAMN04488542_105161 [Fontibacillus panacisegetis]|uniref:DUF5704 domain-containing protein n=1 Tax=Fontibacillus panacisegetis TaxID=670482 RepID=A0A1G7I5I5_9BACL|nr:DUF5704 domain-containing protein [Fontibacillus panacisegetis]SDF07853.1 hypothetical protein SAMN04488542_105161 [Fontibacillus panacisegetis]
MLKKILLVLLPVLCMISFLFQGIELQAAAGVKGPVVLLWTKSEQNENVYYSVGMGYADIWTNSTGEYIEDPYIGGVLKPGSTMDEAHYDWEYQMKYPGRKIKSITAMPFNELRVDGENQEWTEKMFSYARYGLKWEELEKTFAYVHSVAIKNDQIGIGTDKASIIINETFTLTEGQTPEPLDTTGLADNVLGSRYYFPILFKAELEPLEGQAIIKHFTTSGVSLNGVDGFRDYKETLIKNKDYEYKNPTGTAKYTYKGYKKSTREAPSGGAILVGEGPGKFYYDGSYSYYYVYFYYDPVGTDPCIENPDSPGCKEPDPGVQCTDPSAGQTMNGEDLNPNVSAVIRADSRGSERFNVSDGIPTTESLYGNVWSKEYLHKYDYQEMTGSCTFSVNVTILPPPPPPEEEAGEPSTVQVQVDKDYSFWTVKEVEVYKINESALWNYAFDGGGIRIQPSGYSPPSYVVEQTSGYEPSDVPNVSVPHDGDPEAAAERAVSVTVNNDTFTFKNQALMNGSSTTGAGPAPSPIPTAPLTQDNVLYSPNNTVPMSKTNRANQPSTGTIFYGQVNGSATKDYPIYWINPVTVHTPVVIYPDVSDDKAHNQKTTPAAGRSAIILDRPFTVKLPNSGQHTNYLGYGNRNYYKYIGSKQVRFPFDVYDGTKAYFYPKNTWIEVDKSKESFSFFLPVWVDEGFYDVEFRTIAHNAPAGAAQQTNANLSLSNHIAYDIVAVDAIGRVYDFRITDIADYNWETVFRSKQGSSLPTGVSYWVGLNGIDGVARGNSSRYTLPIRPGSHPLYKNAVVKTGYHFKFDLKSKGNMFGVRDQILISPTFYFQSSQGGERIPIDLYYHSSNSSYVQVGSSRDKISRYVILNDRLRNVPVEEMTDTALYKYDYDYTFSQVAGIGRSQFVQRYISYTAKQKTPVGSLSLLTLTEQVRTLIGPKTEIPSGVDQSRVNASVQKWYGEYSLPSDLYAVKSGTNVAEYGRTHGGLTDRSPIFLKNGYIVVNFNIQTVRNGVVDKPYLQYIHAPLMNQWVQMEGFFRNVKGPNGISYQLMDGDVVFYDANTSSRDDFKSMVTH